MRQNKVARIIGRSSGFRQNETEAGGKRLINGDDWITPGALSCGCGKIRPGQEFQRICGEINTRGSGWAKVGELMRITFIRQKVRRIDLAGMGRVSLVASAW